MIDPAALSRLRVDRGFTQRRFANAVGVNYQTIRRIEGGADPGDLPVRVVERMAEALGVPIGRLLTDRGSDEPQHELATRIGAALLAHGRRSKTALATTFSVAVDEVSAAAEVLTCTLPSVGMSLATDQDDIWLTPIVDVTDTAAGERPLTLNEAKLLRRIHRGEDVRRRLTKADRELTLPSLVRRGLVDVTARAVVPTPDASSSLDL